MSHHQKLLMRVLRGGSDANIRFEDLRELLLRLGFEERVRGGHHTFRKRGWRKRSISSEKGARRNLIRCVRFEA